MAQTPRAFRGEGRRVAALSAGKALWWAANGLMARRLARPGVDEAQAPFQPKSAPTDVRALRRRWLEAFRKDAADVAAGLYPPSEALPKSPSEPLRRSLDFLSDARAVDERRRRGQGLQAREHAAAAVYPPYYRQNFHYQSGGWLTSESAQRYETQVEALFTGAAGPMRRRALSLLARGLRSRDQRGLRILDLACGSGAFLKDLTAAFPRALVTGLDFSGPYLREAGRRSTAARVQGAAERLPFADGSFDGVACVFLFHELPPTVRERVAREAFRVLRPGGLFAFADSLQRQDAPEIGRLLEAFPAFFHEPFFESYQAADLQGLFAKAGFAPEGEDQAFLTKALSFRRPEEP